MKILTNKSEMKRLFKQHNKKGKYNMKTIIFTLFLISTLNYAYADDELNKVDAEAADNMFMKVKYILGAVWTVQNKIWIDDFENKVGNERTYKNASDFFIKTKRLKEDVKKLAKQARLLNALNARINMIATLGDIEMCIMSYKFDNPTSYCHQAISQLKTYFWEKAFGVDWSGYPDLQEWNGFPKEMK